MQKLLIMIGSDKRVTPTVAEVPSVVDRWTVRVHMETVRRIKQISAYNGISMGNALERLVDNAYEEMSRDMASQEET